MRIALAIAPADALPSAFVVFRDRLDRSIDKAARLGYDAVELALARADDVDLAATRALLDDNGIGLAAVSTGRVFAEQHVWLTHPDAAIRRRALDILRGLVDVAAELGAPRINIGRVRGLVHEGDSRVSAEARFFEGIRSCAEHAFPSRIDIVLEPVNRYELNYINSVVPDGIEVVSQLGLPNIKLMPDTFHMNIEDASIAGSLRAAGPMVGYIQVADSNRRAPGQGHIEFPLILAALREIGYDDDIGVEILPYPSPDEAASQAIRFLRPLVTSAA